MATFNKYLCSDILQIIADLRGESTVNTDASRIRAVAKAARNLTVRTFWKFYRIKDLTLTSTGAGDYEIGSATYPMRAKGLAEVFSGGTGEANRLQIIDENDYKAMYNEDNTVRVAYEWYDAANDKWMIHVNPDTSGDTITYSFYYQHPAITATTSPVYCPDPDIIARRALAYMYEGEDEDKFQVQYQLSEQLANDWEIIEETPNINQTYTVTTGNDGIGTY